MLPITGGLITPPEARLVPLDDQDEPRHLAPVRVGHRHGRIDGLVRMAQCLNIPGVHGLDPCHENRSQWLESRLWPKAAADPGEVELSLIDLTDAPGNGEAQADDLGFCTEPPDGIEPSTYALRVRRSSRLS